MANASLPCRAGSMTESCPGQKLWNLKYDFKASFAFKYAIESTLSKLVSLVKLTSGQLVLVQSHWLIIVALYRASTIVARLYRLAFHVQTQTANKNSKQTFLCYVVYPGPNGYWSRMQAVHSCDWCYAHGMRARLRGHRYICGGGLSP